MPFNTKYLIHHTAVYPQHFLLETTGIIFTIKTKLELHYQLQQLSIPLSLNIFQQDMIIIC